MIPMVISCGALALYFSHQAIDNHWSACHHSSLSVLSPRAYAHQSSFKLSDLISNCNLGNSETRNSVNPVYWRIHMFLVSLRLFCRDFANCVAQFVRCVVCLVVNGVLLLMIHARESTPRYPMLAILVYDLNGGSS
ncbi:hypothetical protein B0O80DRAFT_426644 [Mortierella sp. GBAus27b]|nr:hypothetical protein B0O80DRAFT_426644 [Mortierella sp. GBAus27b]